MWPSLSVDDASRFDARLDARLRALLHQQPQRQTPRKEPEWMRDGNTNVDVTPSCLEICPLHTAWSATPASFAGSKKRKREAGS